MERTFSWLSNNRSMSNDFARLCATSEAFICVQMTRLLVRRLAALPGVAAVLYLHDAKPPTTAQASGRSGEWTQAVMHPERKSPS